MPDRSETRAAADQMLEILADLHAGEEAKQALLIGSQEFLDKAVEIERLARLAFRWSQLQLQLAERAAARGLSPDAVRLADVEVRPLDVILAHWREAQLRLEIAPPGSAAAQEASDAVERLREEYQAAYDVKAADLVSNNDRTPTSLAIRPSQREDPLADAPAR